MIRGHRGLVSVLLGIAGTLILAGSAWCKPYAVVHALIRPGANPDGSPLVQAGDGTLYGTTVRGGIFGGGTVFRINSAGVLTTIHHFDFPGSPFGLIQAEDGFMIGMTSHGGVAYQGSIFRMDRAGVLTTLHSFSCDTGEGCYPEVPLVQAADGFFYGSAGKMMFRMDSTGNFTNFHSVACSGRCGSVSALIQASDGFFYGTTSGENAGTSWYSGSLFRMDATGTVTTLARGIFGAALIQATDGSFYGVTNRGGSDGSVFRMEANGVYTTLHRFNCGSDGGCQPFSALVQGRDGSFYGTTFYGANYAIGGSIFRVDSSGTFNTLYSFENTSRYGDCEGVDGCFPGSLMLGIDGNLYGSSFNGAAGNAGTLFRVTTAGDFTTLHAFGSTASGTVPHGRLVQASDGRLFGTTRDGGPKGFGTVFSIDRKGVTTVLHSFDCASEGCQPEAGVIQANDGNLYGTTSYGGPGRGGTVFRMTTDGGIRVLHYFYGPNGWHPRASLIQAGDGSLYGATTSGGATGGGIVFKISPDGVFNTPGDFYTLHSFDCSTEGCAPDSALVQVSDGSFYGTTWQSIYRIDQAGRYSVRVFAPCTRDNACFPSGELLQATDGNLYGTTRGDGGFNQGAVFRISPDPDGALAILHSFHCDTEGCRPAAGLAQASDGFLYGTTELGGDVNAGTVYRVGLSGEFSVVHRFACVSEGCQPVTNLLQANDRYLYGTAQAGPGGGGVVFRLRDSRGNGQQAEGQQGNGGRKDGLE
jgi:uncharacterized repeat protein (TIGR03803 family)